MFNIEKVDSFPEIARSGRASEELQSIIDSLKSSAANGERYCISGVNKGNAFNSMQQRIRAQAKKMNLKIMIRFDAGESKLYFKANPMGNLAAIEVEVPSEPKLSVKASQVKSVKVVSDQFQETS